MHATATTRPATTRSPGSAGRRSPSVGVTGPRLVAVPALPRPTGRRLATTTTPHPPTPPPPRRSVSTAAAAGSPGVPATSSIAAFAAAFWAFLRPHTIRGTVLGSIAVTARALLELGAGVWPSLDWAGLLPRAALGVLALLAGNGYIVGINQIYDVDIDAVNKPFLPIAAGKLSPGLAWVLVAALGAAGLALSYSQFGRATTALYGFGLLLGTLYSVPPFRLKRWAVPAFAIIATVRGFLLNYGVYAAVRAALGLPFAWSPALAFITSFVTLFAVAIAVTKDLADVEGDRAFGVETFATRLGVARVAGLGVGILGLNYVGAVALALAHPSTFFRPQFAAAAHAALGLVLARLAASLRSTGYSRTGVTDFYRGVWALFYAEYALLPFL